MLLIHSQIERERERERERETNLYQAQFAHLWWSLVVVHDVSSSVHHVLEENYTFI